ncbi:hypothetical protein IFT48_16500 [Pseudomonas fluorescens]|jgi:hypothetical protein|uniref:Uncharacterized protein n=1 Tax=Pseudomonas simiae TaxID=321846 RepID=A0ABS9FXA3_9PSED|nr:MULTISPECIES: hypothetical protein [Pseudomonas]MBD8091598.1 hypothetical protein [Pseudomonas fluorescens]MBD8716784.1 hypothetical protein [Pseudomonas fluorescens]MCF5185621.1 hypothetical protein [Pseudomonas simiae]MCF5288438.1 hypothetical protein [Pseudomonas simiae]MCF5317092.1 hypothetical protein [Pseudomonas simiae]
MVFFIVVNVNVNGGKKSNEPETGDSQALKRIDLREVIKRVSTTVYVGLGIGKAVLFLRDFFINN